MLFDSSKPPQEASFSRKNQIQNHSTISLRSWSTFKKKTLKMTFSLGQSFAIGLK